MKKIVFNLLFAFIVFCAQANEVVLRNTGNPQLDGTYRDAGEVNGTPSFIKATNGKTYRIGRFKVESGKKGEYFLGWEITDGRGNVYFAATTDSEQPTAEGWDIGRAGAGLNPDFELTYFEEKIPSSQPLVFQIASEMPSFNVFPNPTTGNITITSDQAVQKLTLFSATGQALIVSDGVELDLSSLPAGTYNLSIESGSSRVLRRVVKSN